MGAHLDKPVTEKSTETAVGNGLRIGASAMQGWRKDMEDQHTILVGMPSLPDHTFLAIYDGHGGAETAGLAAEHFISHVQRQPGYTRYIQQHELAKIAASRADRRPADAATEPELLGEAMRSALLELDRGLPERLESRFGSEQSGSTACLVIVAPRHFICANLGDSRACYCRTNIDGLTEICPLSFDHKPSNPVELARIEAAGGKVVADRVDGRLAVSRALGDFEFKDKALAQSDQKVSAEAEITICERTDTDQVMVVACDGIWDEMSNEVACTYALTLLDEGEKNMGCVCEEIVDRCLDLDSRDNMSAIVVAFPAAQVGDGPGIAPRVAKRKAARLAADAEEVKREAEQADRDRVEQARLVASPEPEPENLAAALHVLTRNIDSVPRAPVQKTASPRPPPSTPEQLQDVYRTFDAIDTDGNGVLDKTEVSAALMKLGRGVYGSALDEAFAKMDANCDGKVTLAEFVEYWEAGGKLSAIESLDLKWKQFGNAFDKVANGLLAGAIGVDATQLEKES